MPSASQTFEMRLPSKSCKRGNCPLSSGLQWRPFLVQASRGTQDVAYQELETNRNHMTAGRTINSLSQHWGTPEKYVKAVKEVFGGTIDLDPCSNDYSLVDAEIEYSLPHKDGLKESWNYRRIFVNPPYGADKHRKTSIKHWLCECASAHRTNNAEVIALVPVATNTRHWKDCIFGCATAVCFLYDTRLRFLVNGLDQGKGAPMSCAMAYWGSKYEKFFQVFSEHGAVLDLRPIIGHHLGGRRRVVDPIMRIPTHPLMHIPGQGKSHQPPSEADKPAMLEKSEQSGQPTLFPT